ncbi:hypothetical protein TSOC_014585, partial [Tetrabaena socialis]
VRWFNGRGITLTHRFGELSFDVKGKNDEVLCVASYGAGPLGAVLGIELKKKLSWQGMRQAETEFYLWQSSSQYPFCQVITDMRIGGAYYSEGINDTGNMVVRYRVFNNMEQLYEFMAKLIYGLPKDLNDRLLPRADPTLSVSFPQELLEPRRVKPRLGRYEAMQQLSGGLPPGLAALKLISDKRAEEDDVANLRDVADYFS